MIWIKLLERKQFQASILFLSCIFCRTVVSKIIFHDIVIVDVNFWRKLAKLVLIWMMFAAQGWISVMRKSPELVLWIPFTLSPVWVALSAMSSSNENSEDANRSGMAVNGQWRHQPHVCHLRKSLKQRIFLIIAKIKILSYLKLVSFFKIQAWLHRLLIFLNFLKKVNQ